MPSANAVGLLHEELRRAGSLVLAAADRHKVPAGQALAVDRTGFADAVQQAIEDEPAIQLRACRNVRPAGCGRRPRHHRHRPLTAPALSQAILDATGEGHLAFFDALAPIVHRDSIDFENRLVPIPLRQGGAGRRPRPPTSTARLTATATTPSSTPCWLPTRSPSGTGSATRPYFEGCLPIEVIAARGRDTLRFGPMKPVGLTDPATGARAHAVVQLRQDNALGSLFNMVGFQTKLSHGAQKHVFRLIRG